MQFDQRFSQEESSFGTVQERQVVGLLISIERRTAYLMSEMRQAVELILNSKPLPMLGRDDPSARFASGQRFTNS